MGPMGVLRLVATGLSPKKGQALASSEKNPERHSGGGGLELQCLKYRYGAPQASGLPPTNTKGLEERGREAGWEGTQVEGGQPVRLSIAGTSSVPVAKNPGMSGPGISPELP